MSKAHRIFFSLLVCFLVAASFSPVVWARIINPSSSGGSSAAAFTQSSILVTYPITNTGAIAVAFGTTTANTWGALQTIGAASTTNMTVSQSLGIPNSSTAAPTFAGEVRISTASDQLKFFGSAARTLSPFGSPGFQYNATSSAGLAGTTTSPLPVAAVAGQWDGAYCYTDQGVWNIVFSGNGTASTTMIQASSTPGFISFSSNNTYAVGAKRYVSIASTTQASAAPSVLVCTLRSQVTGS